VVEMLFSSSLIAVVGAGEQVKISSPSPHLPVIFFYMENWLSVSVFLLSYVCGFLQFFSLSPHPSVTPLCG
jgi:hypothetical protein